ncbi:MAG: hypothetical protein WCI45_03245, partial [Desulfuromonadales bacterium]
MTVFVPRECNTALGNRQRKRKKSGIAPASHFSYVRSDYSAFLIESEDAPRLARPGRCTVCR